MKCLLIIFNNMNIVFNLMIRGNFIKMFGLGCVKCVRCMDKCLCSRRASRRTCMTSGDGRETGLRSIV